MAYYTAGIIGQYVRNAATPTLFDISGGNINISGNITAATANIPGFAPTNLIIPGYLRNANPPTEFDISGGNISNAGTATSSNVSVSNTVTTTNVVASGYLRNALTPSQFDISGGNISNSGTTRSAVVVAPIIRDAATPVGLDISGGNITVTGTIIAGAVNATASVGSNIVLQGYLRDAVTPVTLDISGGNISNSGVHRTTGLVATYVRNALTPTTYDISGGNISNSGTTTSANAIVSGYIRNALTPSTLDISGGNISNSGTTQSATFTTLNALTSNTIGGVILENSNISNTGRIFTGSGTANAPSYSFATDASLGLYDPATNVLGVVTAGVERMRVDQSGNVGIGTSNPVTRLQLNSKVVDDASYVYNASAAMIVQPQPTGTSVLNDPTAALYLARQGSAGQSFGAMAGLKLSRFENAGTGNTGSRTRMDIDLTHDTFNEVRVMTMRSDGRVGINTTAPDYALDVSSTAQYQAIFRNPSVAQAGIWVTGAGASNTAGIELYHNSNGQGLYHSNTNPFYIWTNNARRVTIDQSGNTGFGTIVPKNYRLTICGTGRTNGGIAFHSVTNDIPFVGLVFDESANTIGFQTNTGTSDLNCNAMSIVRSGGTAGYVGIGTTAPAYLLDVSGDARMGNGILLSNGSIDASSGTAALPTYSFLGNTNTGIYNPTSNRIGFSINGTQRFQIDPSGNVGINTAIVPSTSIDNCLNGTLHVRAAPGSGETPAILSLQNSSSLFARGIAQIRAVHGNGSGAGNDMTFSTRQDSGGDFNPNNLIFERMRITAAGNVGIGTTAPAAPLDVSGGTSTTAVIIRNTNTTTNTLRLQTNNVKTGQSNVISFEGTDSGTNTGPLCSIAAIDVATGIQGYRGELALRTTNGANNTLEHMRINYLGSVGIGTTAPQARLDVSTGALEGITIRRNGAGPVQLALTNPSTTAYIGVASATGDFLADAGAGDFAFRNNTLSARTVFGNGDGTARSTLCLSNTRVGINCNSPAYTLDVSGIIRGSSNIVAVATASNWVGTTTGFTDTSLTISYTPRQSGTVRLFVEANAEVITGSGAGFDGVVMQLRNNGTLLTQYQMEFDQQALVGRGTNSYAGGRLAFVDVTGLSLINMRVARSGDDTPTVRNGYLRVMELSTI